MTTSPRKHVPLRTCIVCRETTNKRELIRIVRTETGVHIDPTGKYNGRGAYLCDRNDCWQRALAGNTLAKALRITLSEEDRQRLQLANLQP